MNTDQVKGTIDDAAGRAKRQVGEWTGDTNAQLEGLGQQLKGKAEKVWGMAKDAAQEGHQQLKEEAAKAEVAAHEQEEKAKDAAREEQEEAERRQQAERLREEDDLQTHGTGKTVTPAR
jgi:uncharacterized protein YjbJ (UPF0337 family)